MKEGLVTVCLQTPTIEVFFYKYMYVYVYIHIHEFLVIHTQKVNALLHMYKVLYVWGRVRENLCGIGFLFGCMVKFSDFMCVCCNFRC